MQSVALPIFLFLACSIALAIGLLAIAKLLNPDQRAVSNGCRTKAAWTPSTTRGVVSTCGSTCWPSRSWYSTWSCCFCIRGRWPCGRPPAVAPARQPGTAAAPQGIDVAVAAGWSKAVTWCLPAAMVFVALLTPWVRLRLAEGGFSVAVMELPDNVVVTKLDELVSWCRKNSLWPMPFATACCGIELMATGASRHDIARFGAEVFRFSPRQCDLMIVAGRVVMKMLPVLQRIWQQMPEPKWCISMGACASTGGVFDTYCVVQGIDRFLPVDMYVPGCPPRPEQLIQSIIDLQEKIQREGTMFGREFDAPVAAAAEAGVEGCKDRGLKDGDSGSDRDLPESGASTEDRTLKTGGPIRHDHEPTPLQLAKTSPIWP